MPLIDSKQEIQKNLVQIFRQRAARYGNRDALFYFTPDGYKGISWYDWALRVRRTSMGLHSLGIRQGARVAILSENRPEWTYADLGCLGLGASVVPIYPTSSYQEISYIIENGGIETIFVSCEEQCERIHNLAKDFPSLKNWIVFDSSTSRSVRSSISMEELLKKGELYELNNDGLYPALVDEVDPDEVATIIYTSGTTGPPKGVMLTHRNFVANYLSAHEVIEVKETDISMSFLPLSHVFERLAGYYFMAFHGAQIAYARSMKTVAEDIQLIRPTVAAAVPRFYEKIYAGILERVEAGGPKVKKLFHWAVSVGCEVVKKRLSSQPLEFSLKLKYFIAKLLAFAKLRKKLGGRIQFFISGGAPLLKELAEFFYAADVLILEGYGLTETSPVIAVNSAKDPRFGVVGRPLSVAEVKIAEDGEILTRGACVMKGYYKNEEKTAEVIKDGWFYTGDIGEIDQEGFLKITDRKKDIIVTSGGKNVAPQNLENLIQTDTLFAQCVVIGDKRNYLVALIVPNRDEVLAYAQTNGLGDKSWDDLLKERSIYEWAKSRLDAKMKNLAAYEQIKYFTFLPQELTQAASELTPTLKVRRKFVTEKYQAIIENLYAQGNSYQEK